MKSRNKLLIVDGYNVLRSGSRYRHMRAMADYTDEVYNKCREALINDVIAHMGRDYCEAYLVFDGRDNEFSTGVPERIGGVQVVFSPAGSSADTVIEKLAFDARSRGVEVMVVTSDATIQDTVFGLGVDRMSADENPKATVKNTVGERIDASTLAQLKALRDGK